MRALRQLAADELAVLNHQYDGNIIDPLFRWPLPDPADVRLRTQRLSMNGAQSARSPAAWPAGVITSSAASDPVAGSGDAAAQEIFRDAIAIAGADGRNMAMPAEPGLRAPAIEFHHASMDAGSTAARRSRRDRLRHASFQGSAVKTRRSACWGLKTGGTEVETTPSTGQPDYCCLVSFDGRSITRIGANNAYFRNRLLYFHHQN